MAGFVCLTPDSPAGCYQVRTAVVDRVRVIGRRGSTPLACTLSFLGGKGCRLEGGSIFDSKNNAVRTQESIMNAKG